MTTQEYLADKGVTMEQAQTFIMENLDNVENIFDVCKQFGVNNDMLADIVQTSFPDMTITGEIVSSFFTSNGFDGNALGFNSGDNSTIAPSGTLDVSNIGSYPDVYFMQNVSQDVINSAPNLLSIYEGVLGVEKSGYAYASSDTWDSIKDLGYTSGYVQTQGVEQGHLGSSLAYGFDTHSESGVSDIQQLISPTGIFNINANDIAGPYDLILGA